MLQKNWRKTPFPRKKGMYLILFHCSANFKHFDYLENPKNCRGIDIFMNPYNQYIKYLHIYSTVTELHLWKMKNPLKIYYLLVENLTFVKTVNQWSGWSSHKKYRIFIYLRCAFGIDLRGYKKLFQLSSFSAFFSKIISFKELHHTG